jgi:hypothetical protein
MKASDLIGLPVDYSPNGSVHFHDTPYLLPKYFPLFEILPLPDRCSPVNFQPPNPSFSHTPLPRMMLSTTSLKKQIPSSNPTEYLT